MDLDANAEDFFAALNSNEPAAFPAFPPPTPSTASYPHIPEHTLCTKNLIRQNSDAKNRLHVSTTTTLIDTGPSLPMEERIVNVLVPELQVSDVMMLIRKMKQSGKSDADEFTELDAEPKTAPRFRCENCGNTEQNNFITDYARGDTICNGPDGIGCGTVVQDHIVHEGSAYRKFEGEEDKSHHGPAPNKLFSTSHNLRTLISQDGEMAGNLRRAAEFVEMNLSQMGKDERRTRIGYKDQMKQKACRLIDHTVSNLDLHEIVGNRAKKMFAEFRDVREHVHQFEAMVAGCVIAAYTATGREMYSAQHGLCVEVDPFGHSVPSKPIDETKLHPFTCTLCDMKFNARRGMQFHKCTGRPDAIKVENGMKEELTPMDLPGEIQGIVVMRDGKKWFKCPICARMYAKEESLVEHMSRHKNQSQKRRQHIETSTIDPTRQQKRTKLASANPSVQVNRNEQVMFRGAGRRPWIKYLQEESNVS
uniref:Uncharacterized protein AlNc14C157G7680 n=1 Tax=Albugo laibachii Nc14 TaxID=890382 RepID=F0WMJ0_9STRA|nr:conserved hypothetical protein [Albugo laibachii Nc14]|eukprot:CCA22522.1 conserved hypothetical protein [Albugo laibachii Nc14]